MVRYLWALWGLLWLAGCQSAPVETGLSPTQFFLEARVSLRSEDASGRGQLTWVQQGEAYRVTAFGPFGAGLVVLEGAGASATLLQNGQVQVVAPDALLAGWMAVPPPFSALPHWLFGRPAPGLGAVRNRGEGRFEQAGWTVRVRQDGAGRPEQVILTQGATTFTLVPYRWERSQ